MLQWFPGLAAAGVRWWWWYVFMDKTKIQWMHWGAIKGKEDVECWIV
jgi:hypothetical protein